MLAYLLVANASTPAPFRPRQPLKPPIRIVPFPFVFSSVASLRGTPSGLVAFVQDRDDTARRSFLLFPPFSSFPYFPRRIRYAPGYRRWLPFPDYSSVSLVRLPALEESSSPPRYVTTSVPARGRWLFRETGKRKARKNERIRGTTRNVERLRSAGYLRGWPILRPRTSKSRPNERAPEPKLPRNRRNVSGDHSVARALSS